MHINAGCSHYVTVKNDLRQRRFWSVVSIQQFWSGESFHGPDSQALSYELARIPDPEKWEKQ